MHDEGVARSASFYEQVLETAPDAMVIIGADENIRYVNAQLERMFGYSRADLLGKTLEVLVPRRFRANHSKQVSHFFQSPGTRPMGSGLELFGERADGTEVAIEVSLSPVHTAEGVFVSAAIRDITQRKRTEAAAKLAADRLSSAVENIQDALAMFDVRDRLILCNGAYERLFAPTSKETLAGKPYQDLVASWAQGLVFASDDERARFLRGRADARRDGNVTFDVRTVDGRYLRIIDRSTVEGGTVQTVWDLTMDRELSEELQTARSTAEAASAAKSEFLSSMSHELRTPLNAILGFAQLLRRDKKEPLSERHKDRTDEILKGGEHLLRLIDDILDLSRIEAGAVSMSLEPVDVQEVLFEVQKTLEPMASRAGLTMGVEPPGSPLFVMADRTRFAQILMNYGSNAIKYNRPSGGVTFSAAPIDAGFVRVRVSDTGIGVPLEKQGKLFQPFQRAGQETSSIEGTGIGLVITKRLAELMGGAVGFRSVPWEGSEFWVDVPLRKDVPAPKPRPALRQSSILFSAERRHLVLYVEDNPANVAFMKDLLRDFDGIELVCAPTAEMGVELALTHSPSVIIMDINLPGMSGLDALRELRAHAGTAQIPVIALTAAASDRDRKRGEQAGFYRYLTKPVRVEELESALEELLRDAP